MNRASRQEVVGSNPARVACEVFSQTLGKHWTYSAIHTSVYRTKLNQQWICRLFVQISKCQRKNKINEMEIFAS